jgi:hypothetical protein
MIMRIQMIVLSVGSRARFLALAAPFVFVLAGGGCGRGLDARGERAASGLDGGVVHEWFLFIATNLNSELQQALTGLVTSARTGDFIHVVMTPEHQAVSFDIPNGPKSGRIKKLEKSLVRIRAAFERKAASHKRGDPPQIDQPRMAATVAGLRRTTATPKVIVVGSPIYSCPSEAGWTFVNERIPSDASLVEMASDCPLGPKVNTPFPKATEVFWQAEPSWGGNSEEYRQAVNRVWVAFFSARGASLKRVSCDCSAVFARAMTDTPSDSDLRPVVIALPALGPIGMVKYQAKSVVAPAGPDTPVVVPQQAARAVSAATDAPAAPVPAEIGKLAQQAGNWLCAALWTTSGTDIDIWVRRRGEDQPGREVSYRNKSIQGLAMLYRDLQRGQPGDPVAQYAEWECVEVQARSLSEIEIWIDLYATQEPIDVRVILFRKRGDGALERREKTYHFSVTQGDQANAALTRQQSKYWKKIELAE